MFVVREIVVEIIAFGERLRVCRAKQFHGQWIAAFEQQLPAGLVKPRMNEVRNDFAQRNEREPSLRHAGMRNNKIGFVDHFISKEQNINVYRPWPPMDGSFPPEFFLDRMQVGEEWPGRECRLNSNDLIEKQWLFSDAPGLRFVNGRYVDHGPCSPVNFFNGHQKILFAVPQVRP